MDREIILKNTEQLMRGVIENCTKSQWDYLVNNDSEPEASMVKEMSVILRRLRNDFVDLDNCQLGQLSILYVKNFVCFCQYKWDQMSCRV